MTKKIFGSIHAPPKSTIPGSSSATPDSVNPPPLSAPDSIRPALLEVTDLSASYGSHRVLENISLTMGAGDFICLSGPNGCGKSTLMNLIAGLGRQTLQQTGHITVEGQPLRLLASKERAKLIAYMSQTESSLWNFTVRDLILTGRYCHTGFTGIYSRQDKEQVEAAAELLKLTHLLHRPCHSLSGGEFQRLRIARAFCQQPRLLLLDEPAANLDLTLRHDLLRTTQELAKSRETAVLMSIHDINLAAIFAQKLALLRPLRPSCSINSPEAADNNTAIPQLVLGSPQEVMTTQTLRQIYGRNFGIYTHPGYGCPAVYVE